MNEVILEFIFMAVMTFFMAFGLVGCHLEKKKLRIGKNKRTQDRRMDICRLSKNFQFENPDSQFVSPGFFFLKRR